MKDSDTSCEATVISGLTFFDVSFSPRLFRVRGTLSRPRMTCRPNGFIPASSNGRQPDWRASRAAHDAKWDATIESIQLSNAYHHSHGQWQVAAPRADQSDSTIAVSTSFWSIGSRRKHQQQLRPRPNRHDRTGLSNASSYYSQTGQQGAITRLRSIGLRRQPKEAKKTI
ncbi:hypothetical protein CRG98_013557 [Punica granatum]|uniref:Uncharacterized protein n=1 Tax=Punica granatum TaxID=22663 RepID=A0A2I0KC21_PUNGR|nr:hypothetical protein CRG98_013557 [Punica granatum]